ncbi:hypothetical protein [Puniceibacterium confluentis]|uniref:hypothetical protein n=1 Tax=Puniceibacterium confluentis TaxID=1958944 RepID=UPI003563ECD8
MKVALPLLAALAAALFVALSYYTYTVVIPEAGGLWTFDMRVLGYSAETARHYLETLSSRGRAVYLLEVRWLDTVFPVVLGTVLVLAARAGGARVLVLPAVVYVLLDLLENMFVAQLLRAGAERLDPHLVELAALSTMGKYAALVCAVGVVVAQGLRRSGRAAGQG